MIYKIIWTPEAQEDLSHWKANDKTKLIRIKELIDNVMIDPLKGIGKPERLKYKDKNIWSRRIDKKHRLVDLVSDKVVYVIQARFHYKDK